MSRVVINDVTLTPEKAAIIDNTAIIADLHLGFENVLQNKGVAIPRMQLKEILRDVRRVISRYGVDRLVVAGDLKHEFSKNLPYEWEDVREFIDAIDVDLEVVRGNHDNFLAAILAEHGIVLKEKIRVGNYWVVHGHKDFEAERIIIGHEHPAVKVRVRGALYTFPCYLVVERTKIVLPAFSPLMVGSDVLQNSFLSPILERVKDRLKKIEVYAVEDEVLYLGRLEDLRKVV